MDDKDIFTGENSNAGEAEITEKNVSEEKGTIEYVEDDFFGDDEPESEPFGDVFNGESGNGNKFSEESKKSAFLNSQPEQSVYINGIPYYRSESAAKNATNVNKTGKKPKKWMKVTSIVLFVLTLASLFLGIITASAIAESSRYPGIEVVVESMWSFALFLPVSLCSLILGIVFTCKKYRCLKNIIAGAVVSLFLCTFAFFGLCGKLAFTHDMATLNEVTSATGQQFPTDGYLTCDSAESIELVDGGTKKIIRTIQVVFNEGDALNAFESEMTTSAGKEWKDTDFVTTEAGIIGNETAQYVFYYDYYYLECVSKESSEIKEYYLFVYDTTKNYLVIENFRIIENADDAPVTSENGNYF